ncbi:MAG: hypothetical protein QY318_03240 [Candidatus Dojkabacteria bacterium]|nr:MAG: hypothetical protein QY318_03240 [Candidatus Dojkabacteria bacterium]
MNESFRNALLDILEHLDVFIKGWTTWGWIIVEWKTALQAHEACPPAIIATAVSHPQNHLQTAETVCSTQEKNVTGV